MLSLSKPCRYRSRASIVPSPVMQTYVMPQKKSRYEKRAWTPMPEPKQPYVVRPFIKDMHLDDLQHLENRGMYREELDIERSRHPKLSRTLVIRTDGSMDEMEFEFAVPPVLVLFSDRTSTYHAGNARAAKLGRSLTASRRTWENAAPPPPPEASEDVADLWNIVEFPFCVPRKVTPRTVHNVNFDGDSRPSWAQAPDGELAAGDESA
jgi:hypothetical protein